MSPRYTRADAAGHRVADPARSGAAAQHPATGHATAVPRPTGDGGPERRDGERRGPERRAPGRRGSGRRGPRWQESQRRGPGRQGSGRRGQERRGPAWRASRRRGPLGGTGEAR
nr:hypothetical protein StreXyl84_54850 [Streptomyces sp. Xyl84]